MQKFKYRTVTSLIADCKNDLKSYDNKGKIDTSELIKIARKCNYEIGFKLNQTKETIIELNRGKIKLPEDFMKYNFGLLLLEGEVTFQTPLSMTPITEKEVGYVSKASSDIDMCADIKISGDIPLESECNPCCQYPESCEVACDGTVFQVVQKMQSKTIRYRDAIPLKIVNKSIDFDIFCDGRNFQKFNDAQLSNGWLYSAAREGRIYLNYQAEMVDENGDLVVPDHDLLNEYYEYSIKQRILENVLLNGDVDTSLKFKIELIEQRVKNYRLQALSFIKTPDFKEICEVFNMNRKKMYNKYYSKFYGTKTYK